MSSAKAGTFKNVLIVGAGPAGMLLALMLLQAGIPTTLIDMASGVDENPRATHYGPPAMYELNRAGLGDELREQGFLLDTVCWRKLDGEIIAGLTTDPSNKDPDRMVCLPLNRLGLLIQRHLKAQKNCDVRYGHKVIAIGQDGEKAWVEVDTGEGKKTLSASYIVGCDGANSQIRRSLFGDWEFPGRTWDRQVVATNIRYPGFDKAGWPHSSFIVHPEHWCMAAKITKDGLWRFSYGEILGLTNDELRQRLPAKFETVLPGHPKPGEYEVVNFSPYKIHQRLAKQMRVGRFLLAADAAHLCNPFGGMGLTGGIVDIGNLRDCLVGLYEGQADESILDRYDEVRRQKYTDVIDVVSSANIRRLFDQNPDTALDDDEFFQMCKKAEVDPEFAEQMQNGTKSIMYDFTQHYQPRAVAA